MSIFDDIPTTEQSLITFQSYAENQVIALNKSLKQMNKILLEVDRRLELMKGKAKNAKVRN